MESEIKDINIPIPMGQVYKTHILNEMGDVDRVFVFCANFYTSDHLSTIFSETELIHYKENDVNIVFSARLIHKDDTIHEIKQKIVAELIDFQMNHDKSKYNISVDELYLFGNTTKDLDMVKFFQDVTEDEKIPLSKERFFQYLTNISADPYVLEANYSTENPLDRDVFHYDDWMAAAKSGVRNMFAPIGMEFQEQYDFRFPCNPYNNQIWTQPIQYEQTITNPILTFEKSVLLDYTQSTDIMVCLAKNVYEYANTVNIPSDHFCNLYFPFLQKRNLTTIQLLSGSALDIAEETLAQIDSKSFKRKTEVLDTYRIIDWTRRDNSDLPYIERGIRDFSLTLRASDFSHALPMDMLFRNLHATEQTPFIKYNPGNRRENMYRFYSKEISADGRKIPALDEPLIMRLSKDTGKGRQITVYVQGEYPIYINIQANSEIEIAGTLSTSMSVDNLDKMLIASVTPIIRQMNDILTPSGYTVRHFDGVHGYHVHKSSFTYQAVLQIESNLNIEQQLGNITPIFDVFSTNVSKGAKMHFKRVRNYKEMDAKFTLIRKIYEQTADVTHVVQGLIDNFNMNDEEAVLLYGEFRSQFQVLNKRIVENPGFPTEFKMRPLKNEVIVEVTSISSPQYIDVIHLYIDTILRLSQKPKTVTLAAPKLKNFKTKTRSIEHTEDIDVIVAPTEINKDSYKPMMFATSINDDVQEIAKDTPAGLDFEDEYDYSDVVEDDKDASYEEDSDADFYGGDGTPDSDSDSDEEEEYKVNIDGMSIKNPSPFYKRMLEKDPTLYITEESSKFPLYSKACPSGDKRQPVILTDEEKKRIDKTNPGSYGKALLHGSSEDKKHWYVCPRYWCLKTNSSISDADVKAGKCGAIIPRGTDRVPPGAYVYEFNNPKVHMKDGKYVQHVPGFLKKNKHPDGLCVPCCFSKEWDSKDQKGRRDVCEYQDPDKKEGDNKPVSAKKTSNKPAQSQKMLSYVISAVSYPLPQNRWGFMPEALQLFLKSDSSKVVDPQNSALILSGESSLLRYGVEKSDNQSFLACFAYYYAYKHKLPTPPTIAEMRGIFVESINLDMFIQYHNGNLVSIFRPKIVTRSEIEIEQYDETAFYKTIKLEDETQVDYLEDTIASYENFLKFIQDETSVIDHSYLWDFFANRNPKLMLDGLNLVILQISDNDITEKVQMICPSNAYSPVEYNARKETVILVKQENFYEPIHLYEQIDHIVVAKTDNVVYTMKRHESLRNQKVTDAKRNVKYTLKPGETKKSETIFKKAFLENRAIDIIKDMLTLIKATTTKYCAPLPSMPRKYSFKRNIPVIDVIRILKSHQYQVDFQILNYRNKVIGVLVRKHDDQSHVFIPCFPSAIIPDMNTKYMDDESLWIDYRKTRDRLNEISIDTKGALLTKPTIKVVDDGLVVGFLTETNQFVQINPPTQPLDEDGIKVVEHSSNSYSDADKTLTTDNSESKTRRRVIRNINLETQFYNIFRSIVRIQLNEYDNRKLRKEIVNAVDDASYSYANKMKFIEKRLHQLMDDKIAFNEINPDKLRGLETVVMCGVNKDTQKCESNNETGSSTKFCLTTDDDKCLTIFPKLHLLSGNENNRIYFGRMVDELVRYSRIRLFMFQPKTYMNITNTDLQVNDNELFLLESRLTRDYFRNITPYNIDKYVRNIEFDNAQPELSQTYDNKVTIQEQHDIISTKKSTVDNVDQIDKYIIDCIKQTKPNVIGNTKGLWRTTFPSTTKEMIFNNTGECSFIPIIYVFQQVYNSELAVKHIKTSLWKEYARLMEDSINKNKIYSILRNQGKRTMIDRVKSGQITFEALVFSEEYYITDLDWWVFCKTAELPVILFSSTTLKYLQSSLTWLKLGSKGVANEKFYFVRSPVDVKPNSAPAYHVLQPGFSFSELKNDMFSIAERGDEQYRENMQTIETYLQRITMITTKGKK